MEVKVVHTVPRGEQLHVDLFDSNREPHGIRVPSEYFVTSIRRSVGVIAHKLSWIRSVVSARGLRLEISSRRPLAGQIWAIVRWPGA